MGLLEKPSALKAVGFKYCLAGHVYNLVNSYEVEQIQLSLTGFLEKGRWVEGWRGGGGGGAEQ